jgi:hypothetical protein
MNQPWVLGDENGFPLSQGTVVEFPSQFNHQAIIAYDVFGQQVLLEKTLLRGRPTITRTEEYRGVPYGVARKPKSPTHAVNIVRHAVAEIEAGRPWTIFDNCQDLVSRAYDGQSGSKTRNFLVGVAVVFGLVGMVVASSSQ